MPARMWSSANSASAPVEHLEVGRAEDRAPRVDQLLWRHALGVAATSTSCCARCVASSPSTASNDSTFCSPMPAVKLEPVRVVRRDRGERRDGRDAVRQERGAGQRVRAASRAAPDAQPLDPERVADRDDVGRATGDVAAGRPRRAAVPRPVVAEQPDPALGGVAEMRPVEQARPGRSVMREHRDAAGIPALAYGQRAPVRPLDRPQRLHAAGVYEPVAAARRSGHRSRIDPCPVGCSGRCSRSGWPWARSSRRGCSSSVRSRSRPRWRRSSPRPAAVGSLRSSCSGSGRPRRCSCCGRSRARTSASPRRCGRASPRSSARGRSWSRGSTPTAAGSRSAARCGARARSTSNSVIEPGAHVEVAEIQGATALVYE